MDLIQSPTLLAHLRVIGKRASSTFETLCNSYLLAELCKDVKGDFVECGIGRGSQIAAMALASDRTIWAYDSYQGIPLAGPKDTQQPGYGKITSDQNAPLKDRLVPGLGAYSVEQVRGHIAGWGLGDKDIRYVKGWFQDTLPNNEIEKIALLRLDGDLYESTLVCLEHLYPKLVKGGYLIIDDYALTGCRRAIDEYLPNQEFIKVKGGGGPVYMKK